MSWTIKQAGIIAKPKLKTVAPVIGRLQAWFAISGRRLHSGAGNGRNCQ